MSRRLTLMIITLSAVLMGCRLHVDGDQEPTVGRPSADPQPYCYDYVLLHTLTEADISTRSIRLSGRVGDRRYYDAMLDTVRRVCLPAHNRFQRDTATMDVTFRIEARSADALLPPAEGALLLCYLAVYTEQSPDTLWRTGIPLDKTGTIRVVYPPTANPADLPK